MTKLIIFIKLYVSEVAVKKYKLNVLTYTFDNGFVSDFARKNIETSVKNCGVDHIWVKHDIKLISELYSTALIQSGEICGICGVGIERSMLKISEAWKTPIILLGHSPTEANSFTSENLQLAPKKGLVSIFSLTLNFLLAIVHTINLVRRF